MCNVWVKVAAHEWEKEAAWATLDQIRQEEWDEQAAQRKEKECKLQRVHQCEAGHKLVKEGAQQQWKVPKLHVLVSKLFMRYIIYRTISGPYTISCQEYKLEVWCQNCNTLLNIQ